MNIHEYQAKAVLREFGVPVPARHPGLLGRGGRERRPSARRPGLGRQSADPCRRPRQGGRRQGRQDDPGREAARRPGCSARRSSPTRPAPRARWSTGSTSRKARRSTRSSISRPWSTAPPRGSPSSPRPRAAWTSRRSPTRRRRRSSPSRSTRRPASCPITAAGWPRRSGSPAISPSRPKPCWASSTAPSSPRT